LSSAGRGNEMLNIARSALEFANSPMVRNALEFANSPMVRSTLEVVKGLNLAGAMGSACGGWQQSGSTPSAVAVPLRAVPASPAPEDRPARIARAVARVRALQASNSRGVRETVAGEFGVSLRTVGKWLAEVEGKEAEARKAGMFNSLRAGAAGRN